MKSFSMLALALAVIAVAGGCCCCRGLFSPPATYAAAPVVQQPACDTCNTCPAPTTYGYGAAPTCSYPQAPAYATPATYGYSPAPTYDYGTYGSAPATYSSPAYSTPSYSTPAYAAPSSSCPNCVP